MHIEILTFKHYKDPEEQILDRVEILEVKLVPTTEGDHTFLDCLRRLASQVSEENPLLLGAKIEGIEEAVLETW